MIPWLKRHFIPHTRNSHRPHFLHTKTTQRVLVLVVLLELLVYVLPTLTFVNRADNPNLASVLPGVLAVLTNEERKQNNLNELTINPLLAEAAQLKAQDMAEKGYFAHTSPEGRTPWYWLNKVGYKYDYAGENLAINFTDSQDVTDAWMDSSTHRANIIKSAYTEIGTGVATGIYEGRRTVFVAQLYANPRVDRVESLPPAPAVSDNLATAVSSDPVASESEKELTTVAVANSDIQTNVTETEVLGVESKVEQETEVTKSTSPVPSVTKLEKMSASPRHAADVLFLIILAVTIIALVLNVLIKINVQHPDLITNGMIVVAVLIAILIANNFFGTKNLVISQGLDYSYSDIVKK